MCGLKSLPSGGFEIINGEGYIGDEISVVADHGPNYRFAHPERRVLQSQGNQVSLNLHVGDWPHLYWNTSLPVCTMINCPSPTLVTQYRNVHIIDIMINIR